MCLPAVGTLWVLTASSSHLWKQVTCQDLWQDGNPALIKLLRAVLLVAVAAWTHKQRRKGAHRLTETLCEAASPDPLVLSSGCDPLPCGLGVWEHRARGSCGRQQQSLCGTLSSPPPPTLGQHSKVHCIASPPPHTHRALTVGFVRLGGGKQQTYQCKF